MPNPVQYAPRYVCHRCECIGTEQPCWYCGNDDLVMHSWLPFRGHTHDSSVRAVNLYGAMAPSIVYLTDEDLEDTTLPWQVSPSPEP